MSPNDQPKPDLQYCPTHGARVPRGGRSHFGVTWRTSSQCAGTFHTFPVSNWCIGGGRACLRGALRPPASCGAGMVAASSKLDDPSGSESDSSSEGPPRWCRILAKRIPVLGLFRLRVRSPVAKRSRPPSTRWPPSRWRNMGFPPRGRYCRCMRGWVTRGPGPGPLASGRGG
jgi:hypothetical protein